MNVTVKRIYDDPHVADGTRVLVDRLWPRGVSNEAAAIDLWCTNLAPTPDLHRWFNHDPAQFDAYAAEYRRELTQRLEAADALLARLDKRRRLTLLTATRDLLHSHASVLRDWLASRASV